jgi:hypothetical protein
MNGASNFNSRQSMPGSGNMPNNISGNMPTMPRVGHDFGEMLSPSPLDSLNFGGQPPLSAAGDINITPSFQQPFVPQDLWQMPMTIEWDWADMSTNFPVFGGDPTSNH